jgi:hypothetical protein
MQLADLQRALAASLTGRSAPPAGCSTSSIERARRALAAKRRRAVRQLLPRTAAALKDRWDDCWQPHCDHYAPSGMLYHVDDAWELAAHLAAKGLRAATMPLPSLRTSAKPPTTTWSACGSATLARVAREARASANGAGSSSPGSQARAALCWYGCPAGEGSCGIGRCGTAERRGCGIGEAAPTISPACPSLADMRF